MLAAHVLPMKHTSASQAVAKRLRDLREAAGLTQAQLADRLNTSQPTIQRLETGERRITFEWAEKLAAIYGIHVLELRPPAPELPAEAERLARAGGPVSLPKTPVGPRAIPATMPVFAARGGEDQEMFLDDGPIGFTEVPGSLRDVKDAYGIYMMGESMSPRYEPGWLLHVNPYKPPAVGRDVVVQKKDNSITVKTLVGWSKGTLLLKSVNPDYDQNIRIPGPEIRTVHLIVGADQEG